MKLAAEHRRALDMLAASERGMTEALLIDVLVDLIGISLASAAPAVASSCRASESQDRAMGKSSRDC